MVRATWVLLGVVLGFGCVQSNAVPCGEGLFCPAGSQCDPDVPGRCLRPEQLAACTSVADGTGCSIEDKQGTCRSGACELWACGDGYANGNDSCDGNDLRGKSCIDVGYYAAGGLACTPSCELDLEACGGGRCNDGKLDPPEACDGTTNKTCISIGFDGGTVGCNVKTCAFTISDCSRFGWNPEALNNVIALAVGGVSPADIWAVGDNGRANHYDGLSWTPVSTNVANDLIAVWAVSATDVWAVGQGQSSANPALLLRYDGTAWNPVTSAPVADYVDIWAAAPNAVFAATTANGIQAWNGTMWAELGMLNRTPIAIRGSSVNDIWVATETDAVTGPLMHWNGTGWAAASLSNAKIRFIDVNAPNDVWVAGHDNTSPTNGVIGHFDGTAWTTWRTAGEVYNDIASSSPKDAWVAGSDGQMRHFDGVGWTPTNPIGASPSGTAAISGLISFSAIEVVAVSTLNLAYRYRGQAFGRFPPLPYPDPFAASVNRAMWGTSAANIWVATNKGEVFHYNGTAWSLSLRIDPAGTVIASSIWGTSASDVWVTTSDGRVFRFDGTTWTPYQVTGTGIPLHEIWGAGPNDIWAFGISGAHHWDGATWTPHTLSNTLVLGAEGSGSNDIYAVTRPDANGNALWHWNGTRWTAVPQTGPLAFVATTELTNVVAITPNLVFVIAKNGHIHRWNGMTWTDDIVEAASELRFIAGSATDDVVAASDRELFHWDDRQWSAMRPPIDFVPNTLDYLPMADLLVTPGRIDMLMERFRVRTLMRTRPLKCRIKELSCTDGVDDDCNGLVDGADASQCP